MCALNYGSWASVEYTFEPTHGSEASIERDGMG